MYKAPIIVALILAVVIIAFGLAVANNYVTNVYEPAIAKIDALAIAQKKAAADKTSTKVVELTATQKAVDQQATIDTRATMTAAPTPTPKMITCEATTMSDSLPISPVPGLVYQEDVPNIVPVFSTVLVDGKLRDPAWVHVTFNGQSGFMRTSTINFKDPNCKPGIADLHFLAGWLESGWRVLVDDTFTSILYPWYTQDKIEQLIADINGDESFLPVSAEKTEKIFSTEALSRTQISAFTLRTYFKIMLQNEGSFVGFRFNENSGSFYQIRFFPKECTYSIYENQNKLLSANLNKVVCGRQSYAVTLSVDTNYELSFNINGADSGPISIPGLKDNNPVGGGISLTVSNLDVNFNYIVVIAPK